MEIFIDVYYGIVMLDMGNRICTIVILEYVILTGSIPVLKFNPIEKSRGILRIVTNIKKNVTTMKKNY